MLSGRRERQRLSELAFRDVLTGLPNRHAMNRFFETSSREEEIAVLFLDLDQFKTVNDTLGHHVGDLLVKEVGERLSCFATGKQRVFRLGGDEFLITAPAADQPSAEQLAASVLRSLKKPFHLEGHELYVTGSIGISRGRVQGDNRYTLLKEADTAMYRAKRNGKNRYYAFNEQLGAEEARKLELEKDLQRALARHEFHLEFQPKWNVKNDRLAGLEALIRWKHDRLGTIPPSEFIPVAEENGFIIPLTKWTLEEACRKCRAWQNRGIFQTVSVNLSPRLFRNELLYDMVRSALHHTGLQPQWLELELTEAAVLSDMDDAVIQLKMLRSLGVRLSLDDFGTGSSSIGLLERVRIHTLKLDGLFTGDISEPGKRAIVQALMLLAEQLDFEIVAEGVETPEQMELLQELGCEVMQGYYYGRPMGAAALDKWLRDMNVSRELRMVR